MFGRDKRRDGVSYVSAPVLLNLLNELGKRDKTHFHNEFNKFNNTGARMLDSVYHMTLKLLKNVKILPFLRNVKMDVIMLGY